MTDEQVDEIVDTLNSERFCDQALAQVWATLLDEGRRHVSNDNPFSEAQFKTMKNSPRFLARFTSLAHARAFTDAFLAHYNHHHRSGIGYHTPATVHTGHHHAIRAHRQAVLGHAYATQPHRFRRPPIARSVPDIASINPPEPNPSQTA